MKTSKIFEKDQKGGGKGRSGSLENGNDLSDFHHIYTFLKGMIVYFPNFSKKKFVCLFPSHILAVENSAPKKTKTDFLRFGSEISAQNCRFGQNILVVKISFFCKISSFKTF